jgi:hypothetical protein
LCFFLFLLEELVSSSFCFALEDESADLAAEESLVDAAAGWVPPGWASAPLSTGEPVPG